MDWFEILLVLIFFGAPLLGRIFKPNVPPGLPPVETEDHGEEPARIPAPAEARQGAHAPVPATVGSAGSGGGWSAGWGEWPGMEAEEDEEDAAGAEGFAAGRAADEEGIHTREAMSLEPVAPQEVVLRPLPAPVPVSLDVAEVDRQAEHARLHRRFARPAAAAPRPRPDRLADHLRSRAELRRAVLLAEALGPPRSLRPLEERG